MKSNIVLIGMPGCGKSTIGRLLAKKLGKKAVDADRLIEEREGMKLQEIIDAKGNDYFSKLEEDVLSSIECEDHIISPGGSVCYYPKAMEHLGRIAELVYIEVSCRELRRRIRNMQTRGIVFKPNQSFEDLYKERTPLYKKYAGHIINTTGLSPKEATQRLLELLR